MSEAAYTLARYCVRPGHEEAFLATWRELAGVFRTLPEPPSWGTLVQSASDPAVYYSFGPWRDPAHVRAMREAPEAQAAFDRVAAHCEVIEPGDYKLVEHVQVRPA